MQASMGQAATSLSAGLLDILGDNTDGDMEDNLEALLFCARQELTEAVKIGSDCIPATRKLLQIKCSVALKYAALSVRQILQDNKESAKQLKTIPQALSILEKYGRHLLKPKEQRANLWREIKFNNPIFRDRVLPMKGSLDIVQQMGYTQKTDDGLQFGYDEPDPGTTENLVADIVLARLEMESYLTGSHPHPEVIHCWLPQSTINQLLTLWDQLGGEESGTFTINRSAAITTNMFLPPTPVPVNEKEKNVLVTPDQQVTKIPPTFVSGDVMLSNSFHQQRDSSIRKACDICGETEVALWCQLCDSKQLCDKCDDMWHRHPKRQNHQRKPIACFPSPTSTDLPGANIMGPFGIRAAHSIRENFPIPVSNAHLPTPAVIPKQPALDSSLQQHLQQLHHYQQLQEQQHKQIQNYSNDYSSDKFYHSCNNFPTPATGQQRWTQSSEYVQTTPSVLNNLPQPADIFNRKDALPFVQRMQSGTGQDKKFNSGFYQLRNVPVSTEMPGLPYHQMIEEKHLPLVTSTIASTPVLESGWNTMRFDQQSMSSIFKLATSQQSGLLSRIVAESDFEKRIVKCDIHTLALKEELDLIAKELDDLLMHYDDVCEHEKFRSLTCRKATLLREYQSLSNYKHELQALMDAGSQSTLVSKETNHPSEVFNPPFLASPLLPTLNPLQQQTSLYHPQQVSAASHLQHTKSVHQPISVQLFNQQGSPNQMHVTPSLFNGQNNIGLLEEESQKVHFKMMSPIPTVESTELAVPTEFKVPSVSLCTEMPTTAISSSLLSHSIKKPFTVAETVLETRLRDTHLSSSNTLFQPEVSIASALPSNMENTVCARPLDSVHSKLTDLSESHLEKISQQKTRGSPPISASTKFELPQNDWQCEHCTFINTAGTRVCIICHRTSDSPVLLPLKERLTNSGQPNQSVQSFHQSPDKARIPSDSQVASGGRDVHLGNIVRKIVEDQDQVYLEKKEAQKKYILFQEKAQTVEQQGQLCRAQHNIALLTGQIESCTITHNQEVSPLSSNPKQSEHISPKDTLSAKRPSQVSVNIKETGNGGGDNLPVLDSSSIQGSELSSISSLGEFHEKMERLQEQKRQKQQDLDGADLLYFIKMADRQGYGLKEMEIALFHCQGKSQEALSWLQTNWSKMVEVIISSTTSEGQRCQHNDVGELSQKEAIEALKECAGELGPAVKKCVSRRKELYKVLNPSGTYAREEVLLAMLQGQGQEEAAREKLNKTVLQPFFDRIWEGIDQEGSRNGIVTGGRLLQQAASDTCLSVSTSVISHEDFQQAVLDKNIDKERRIRMVLVEGKLRSWGRAELVIKLLDQDLPEAYSRIAGSSQEDADYCLDDVIEAVRNCRDRRSALVYLMQECQICLAHYPMSKIRNLNFCQCKICSDCLKQNFEVVIREKHVRHWTCPLCGLPDLNNADTASEYFTFLGMLLQMQVDREVVTLFEIKMRDWSLQKDPNFRWCAHCGNGFIADRGQLRMVCPHCSQKTCYNCKRQWEDQHEGLTCEQYEQWKIDNDPSNQAVGLARHLEENGIDCPSCKMRYALAKGGCMHFKCPQCGHEFCSGCSEPFYHRGTCSRFKNCKTNGLHAHHPRDCFFYLRDYEVAQLQSLLKGAKVDFNTVTPQSQDDATHCPVIEQKEFDSGKRDESCGKETQEGHAGLCVQHYKEYLVSLINKKHVDPVCAMNVEELIKLIKRGEISAPKQNHNETPSAYRMRLIKGTNTAEPPDLSRENSSSWNILQHSREHVKN